MIKLVVDTNVIISAALSDKGKPAQIIDMISKGKFQLYYNEQILSEYSNVLSRKKFMFTLDKQVVLLNKIVEMGVTYEPITSVAPMPDEDDRIFYDTAKESGAFLITGNRRHYPDESFIMTPSDFLDALIK